jgi:hypothetical protein
VSVPPDRSMGAVLVRAFLFFAAGFVLAYAVSSLAFGVWRRNAGAANESLLENAAVTAYMLLVTAVPTAFGFAIVTSPWPRFRELRPAHVAWLAVAAGVVTYAAQLTGLVAVLYFIPVPAGFGPIGAAIRLLLPGIAAGGIALAAARLLRLAPASHGA